MGLAEKLQLKPGKRIRLTGAPHAEGLNLPAAVDAEAVLLFVRNRGELETRAAPFVQAALADHLAWIAYPKGGQLDTDLNRDTIWEILKSEKIRPVRQISIDEVWSALRFRPE